MPKKPEFTTKDAIVLAYSNPTFMRDLLARPENFAEQFSLDPQAVAILRQLDPDEVEQLSGVVTNPVEFARAASSISSLTSRLAVSGGGY